MENLDNPVIWAEQDLSVRISSSGLTVRMKPVGGDTWETVYVKEPHQMMPWSGGAAGNQTATQFLTEILRHNTFTADVYQAIDGFVGVADWSLYAMGPFVRLGLKKSELEDEKLRALADAMLILGALRSSCSCDKSIIHREIGWRKLHGALSHLQARVQLVLEDRDNLATITFTPFAPHTTSESL